MNKPFFTKLFIVISLAGFIWLSTLSGRVEAQETEPGDDCTSCHESTAVLFETGLHADQLQCSACHADTAGDHPRTIMDNTSNACDACHVADAGAFALSAHGAAGLACTSCHDVHKAAIEFSTNRTLQIDQGPSQLCAGCHADTSGSSIHRSHANRNVLCLDCHAPEDPNLHVYSGNAKSCASCHDQPMVSLASSAGPDALSRVDLAESDLHTAPTPVSPWGYALVSALLGVGAGVIGAPWMEKLLRSARQTGKGNSHDQSI